MKRILPLLVLALGLVFVGSTLRTPHLGGAYDLDAFGRLPVVKNGRVKPLDTVARTSLLQFQGRQTVRLEDGTKLQPIEWLTRLLFNPAEADQMKTFEITHPEVLSLMHVTTDDGAGKKRFSFKQLRDHISDLEQQVGLARNVEAKSRTKFQSACIQLYNSITLYQQLKYSAQNPENGDFLGEITDFANSIPAAAIAMTAKDQGKEFDQSKIDAITERYNTYNFMSEFSALLLIPPSQPDAKNRLEWEKVGQSLIDTFQTAELSPSVMAWAGMGNTWNTNQPDHFNTLVKLYREELARNYGDELSKSDIETKFNSAAPFVSSTYLYVVALILAVISWLRWPESLGRSAYYLTILAFLLATTGLFLRMWLENRPPVTNLYSSAVFVGWGAVFLCIFLEYFYRNAIATAVAGLIGFATLIIAHQLSLSGDTMEMMRAVLDNNFWLATHVTVVTLGYSATFVAGALGIAYVVLEFMAKTLNQKSRRTLTGMIYGVVCFATLFSLVGTILGGIWADQSWGRFWGWDPKENGALMIVLWNSIILHARWGGLVRERGLANLAIVGNIVTAWSWFGTNLLGVGLHSYGFTQNGAIALGAFIISQLALIVFTFLSSKSEPTQLAHSA